MPKINIDQSGCRACSLCVEICPTKVLAMNASGESAFVEREADCIGCTSCMYLCPSRCLSISDYTEQRPFHWIEENVAIVSKFLNRRPAISTLSEADYDEALRDISTRLTALAQTMAETVGRGQKALGRQSGQMAATHLPEMYESVTVDDVLEKLRKRFVYCFDFTPTTSADGNKISLSFDHCALAGVVARAGEKPGESTLCLVFHEFWAGLIGAFAKKRYQVEMARVGERCDMNLDART